jgi:Malonate decarboxylase gamma subunit (MdcE)
MRRKDLDKLYPEGYELFHSSNLATGSATMDGKSVALAGWLGGGAMDAAGAWRLADAVLKAASVQELHLLIDCAAHSTSLDDERLLLSEFMAHLAASVHETARRAIAVRTFVLETLGGGVYLATTAAAVEVALLYGSSIQLLPGRAIASILGDGATQEFTIADYRKAGVADREVKLGLI